MSEEARHSCCAPSGSRPAGATRPAAPAVSRSEAPRAAPAGMVLLPGGPFLMGSDDGTFPADGEGPVREVTLSPFRLCRYAVTTAEFQAFVAATGYRTEAETFGWSFVFHLFLPDAFPPTRGVAEAPWWRQVYGADWRHPDGPHSGIDARLDHPVVHVSWHDAVAYADWAGARLPTEAEWEYAARGGLVQQRYPWGDRLIPQGRHRCNIWQGTFPTRNTTKDGFLGTAPVDAYEPNGFGLYNLAGNVWEWCSDRWSASHHREGPRHDPQGPPEGASRVTRGGSYLCHASYCNRYRVSARTQNTPDSSSGHMGFRLASDA